MGREKRLGPECRRVVPESPGVIICVVDRARRRWAVHRRKSTMEEKCYPVRFVWDRGGKEVHVCITSSAGESRTLALSRVGEEAHHEVVVKLAVGRFEYR